ncbi:hypothetical protein G4Y73_13335 [Wenzhouxiangella sp. XN201]|uniref:hypothetical protein n=1 Tax=Wenzhouxiangella sp. XN201 TaxID=2710755 RepID=UPI0013C7F440|nr:hypothetical protein [Wenzhouxiangella sp. XN201]NEZ05134.1 hypothetical protein [Wenzhouxiangella sp. XN201]
MHCIRPHEALTLLGLMLFATFIQAGTVASGCDELDAFPASPAIDFATQIQPILDGCTGCHGASGPAGLDLREGEAWSNLVGVPATTNPERLRVAPFDPQDSVLFNAVNCDNPGGPSFRMPGTTAEQRALIRDWIAQGALEEPPAPEAQAVPFMPAPIAILLALLLALMAARRFNRPPGA